LKFARDGAALREDAGAVAEGIVVDQLIASARVFTPTMTMTGPKISVV
jgi:hypothetical protein